MVLLQFSTYALKVYLFVSYKSTIVFYRRVPQYCSTFGTVLPICTAIALMIATVVFSLVISLLMQTALLTHHKDNDAIFTSFVFLCDGCLTKTWLFDIL